MTDFSCAYPDPGAISDLEQVCDDDEDVDSTTSTTPGSEQPKIETQGSLKEESAVSNHNVQFEHIVPKTTSLPNNSGEPDGKTRDVPQTSCDPVPDKETKSVERQPLNLLDLPVDLLQEIIKEVIHTNDLTSLALTCSTLHSLAIPQMYSRFDIVWPDAFPQTEHPAGVDALSYGLATLVMGEDIFREVPSASIPPPCSHCGCNSRIPYLQHAGNSERRVRRGNYFAQYTRKFSVGNGPSDWVQEYSVTKETGKMLGTLVALAVARMVNLETFVWDMPTGVVRDVWIALASLADRPGHDCRLENVWIRWHDNSENISRSSPAVPTASSLTLPETRSLISPSIGSPLFRKYGHVEYPSLSILPPLKSLSVLDIDETSYLEEMAVLIQRSWDRLKELRIGLSAKTYQAECWKPRNSTHISDDTIFPTVPEWPKPGGVLGVVLGWHSHLACEPMSKQEESSKCDKGKEPGTVLQAAGLTPAGTVVASSPSSSDPTLDQNAEGAQTVTESEILPGSIRQGKSPMDSSEKSTRESHTSGLDSDRQMLKLEVLELERVSLSATVLFASLDWTRITTLTILRCESHEKLWRALRRRFAPPAPSTRSQYSRKDGLGQDKASEYRLRLRHLHTDAVSPYLLLFIKDTLPPNTLETVFLHGAPIHDSAVQVEGIYRNVIRNHRSSLRKLLVDSSGRAPGGVEIGTSRWRKWMFTREMITFMTSGRMPKLRELSITIDSKDWHYFLQRLPHIPHLRALHIPHIVHAIHPELKELALQVLDIVTLRPEINLSYVGIQNKCYEIMEGKGDEYDLGNNDVTHSEGFVPGAETWTGSDTNDEDSDDGDEGSTIDSHSELSSDDRRSLDDDDGSEYDYDRPCVSYRLREILFYDDKIAIFKARHGVL
ncbi:hypothetical protein BJX63DRAFT_428468 [Aspergillus granulosus]|uniref:F-box domain-containing protein n=1 Tax=Aspergillus granulosus TaxID=176169 RepID=A0ABR4HW15_9EURO